MKTFAEWLAEICPNPPVEEMYELAKAAWYASRDECALVCDAQAKEPECPERAEYCALEIRGA